MRMVRAAAMPTWPASRPASRLGTVGTRVVTVSVVLTVWLLPGVVDGRVSGPLVVGASCGRTFAFRGDRRIVVELSRALANYTGRTGMLDRCRPWSVTVWRAGRQLKLEIADGAGVTVVREVGGVQVAAAVVDSWVRGAAATARRASPRRVDSGRTTSVITPSGRGHRADSADT